MNSPSLQSPHSLVREVLKSYVFLGVACDRNVNAFRLEVIDSSVREHVAVREVRGVYDVGDIRGVGERYHVGLRLAVVVAVDRFWSRR